MTGVAFGFMAHVTRMVWDDFLLGNTNLDWNNVSEVDPRAVSNGKSSNLEWWIARPTHIDGRFHYAVLVYDWLFVSSYFTNSWSDADNSEQEEAFQELGDLIYEAVRKFHVKVKIFGGDWQVQLPPDVVGLGMDTGSQTELATIEFYQRWKVHAVNPFF